MDCQLKRDVNPFAVASRVFFSSYPRRKFSLATRKSSKNANYLADPYLQLPLHSELLWALITILVAESSTANLQKRRDVSDA